MDHADMHTKDFAWLFVHVHYLEDFRIVASDMTNHVITMLAPCLMPMEPDTREPITAEGPDSTRLVHHMSLPCLKSVQLFNCHQFSGVAIVQALTQCMVVMDRLARHGIVEFAPLEDVAIVQCSRFMVEHDAELGVTLGERLCFH